MPASTRWSTFTALRARNYRLYWLGLICYVLGHRAEYVTFAWITWELTRDPMALGYLGLAQGVPLVVFQLWGGVLADRMNRLKLLIGTQTLTAITLTIAFSLTVVGRMRFAHLLALAAASSVFRAFDEPARLSLVPGLIDRARLPNAIALGSIPWQAGRMIGPSVTGIVIAAFGGSVGFGMAAVASYLALALYSRIRLEADRATGPRQHALREFAEGLAAVGGNFVFTGLIGLAMFNSLFGMSYVTLLPIFADTYFNAGSTGYGLLNAAQGVGSLFGTLTIATIAHRLVRRGRIVLAVAACVGVELMVFAMAPSMWLALPVLMVVGFSHTFYLTQVSTFIQQNVAEQFRGRVLSIYSLCWNLMPLGGLLGGMLAASVSARFAVLVGGAMVAANALLLLTSRRLRALD
ncbi:MAG TPA: MFS transporter [Candidatus Acidoferrum sp.]|nr:MFS transporter [Candidatus Acidoferrum sp.]